MGRKANPKFEVWITRIDPEHLAPLTEMLESFYRWKNGEYRFVQADEANQMVTDKLLEPTYSKRPYEGIVGVCRSGFTETTTSLGHATVHQRMMDMVEAFQRGWASHAQSTRQPSEPKKEKRL